MESENVAHGTKYFFLPIDRPPDPRGQKVKIQLFHSMVISHIKLNGIRKCSNVVPTISQTLPLTLGIKRSKFNFLKQFHAAYKIKGNQLFQDRDMLHINLLESRNVAIW